MKREEKTEQELWDILNRELDQLPDSEGSRFGSRPHRLPEPTAIGRNWAIRGNLLLGPSASPNPKRVANLVDRAYGEYNLPPTES